RPRAQVVAVGEAARDDDRVGSSQVAVAVPDQLRVAHAAGRFERVELVAGAGKSKDAEPHSALTRPPRSRSPPRAGWRAACRTAAGARLAPARPTRPSDR